MKRRISLLLALVIVLGSFGTAFAAVPTTAEGKADFLKEQEILQGNKKGELMLDMKENRQNMVVMLSRLMQKADEAKDYTGKEADKFEDVINKDYRTYIAWSVANNYIVGKSETNFGSHDKVTAQHYSIVLLRALNYFSAENLKLESEEGFAKAKELGLLKDLEEVKAKDELKRADMSVMIYNALGTTVNGENITLAEKLGIKMPVDETLEVKKVRTENLGEVIVELSNAAAVANQKELLNPDNYNVFGSQDRTVKEIKLDGNNVIVVLENHKKETPLVAGREYELVIRNVDSAINGEHHFKATDNTIPVAEKIVALGEYGIKVIFSEPIKNTDDLETKFVLKDAKYGNVNMEVKYYGGRELTLIPYHRGEKFPLGEATLVVKPVEDLSGLKSIQTELKAEVKHNSVKPEVEKVEVKNTRVVVTFKEDVYSRSIEPANISWSEIKGGSVTKATKANILDGKRVEYLFEGDAQIPASLKDDRVEIIITGVANFSKVEMLKYNKYHKVDLDYTRPEVKGFYLESVDGEPNKEEAIVRTRLHFTKDLDETYVKNLSAKELADNIKLYETKENKYDDLVIDKLIEGAIKSAKVERGNELVVSFNKDVIKAGENYMLEVKGFKDNTSLRNRMVDFGPKMFREGQTKGFYVTDASHEVLNKDDRRGMIKVTLNFSRPVNRDTAINKTNYVFTLRNGKVVDMLDMTGDNEIVVRNNGKSVDLYLAQGKVEAEELFSLRLKDSIKDVDGNRLKEEYIYHFDGRTDLTIELDNAKISLDKEIKLMEAGIVKVEKQLEKENLHAEAKKAMVEAVKEAKAKVKEAKALLIKYEDTITADMTKEQLKAAIKEVEDMEEALEDNREDNLELAKAKGDVEHDLVGKKDRLDAADFINLKAKAEALLEKNILNSDKISLEAAIAKLEEALKVEGTNEVKKEALEAAKVRLEAAIDDTVDRPETVLEVEAEFKQAPTMKPILVIKDPRITEENLTKIVINGKTTEKFLFEANELRVIVGEEGTEFKSGTITAGGVEYKIVVK